MSTAKEWSNSSAVEYYAQNRNEEGDLYPSERVYLPRVLFPGAKVLDVGCAAGGFYNIMKSIEPQIEYTGIDISEPAIEVARHKYPDARFKVTDGTKIPYDDNSFDLVHCVSVLVVVPRYEDVLKEMYRVSNRFVLADLRILKNVGDGKNFRDSYYQIKFDHEDEEARVPYVISDADRVANFLLGLSPRPQALRGTGYFHGVSEFTKAPIKEVCIGMFLLQKGDPDTEKTELDLQELPIDFQIEPRFI